MIASLFVILLGALFIAVAIAWVVGPLRLLAGLVAVPIMWVIVLVGVAATRFILRSHGGV